MSIREPAADRNGVLWMENVRGRRVVDDYGLPEITTDLGKVLHNLSENVCRAQAEDSP